MSRVEIIGRIVKPILFGICLLPLVVLLFSDLGANPVEALTHATGDWALRFLLITLAINPLRRVSGWGDLVRLRRMLGLYAFFYACLHVVIYAVLDLGLQWERIWDDVLKRPYITVGLSVFVMLIPLAITSTNGMMRRLGGRRWRRLHRLVYPAAVGAVLHFLWLVKADLREPLMYFALLLLLFTARLLPWWRKRFALRATAPTI